MAEIPLALVPQALDNHAVALWVIGSLVGLMVIGGPFVFRQAVKLIMAHKKKLDDDLAVCALERQQFAEERQQFAEERQRLATRIESVMGEQRVELVKTVAATNHVMDRVADSHEALTNAVHKLCAKLDVTGPHPTRGART